MDRVFFRLVEFFLCLFSGLFVDKVALLKLVDAAVDVDFLGRRKELFGALEVLVEKACALGVVVAVADPLVADDLDSHIKEDETLYEHIGANGYIYAIDAPLAYDDATRNNLAKSRIRMDCMSFFPEVMNNDIRRVPLTDAAHQWVHFPDDDEYKYIGNLSINKGSTFVYYNAYGLKFGSLCGDEVKCVGHWELVFTLPPVPKRGTYEVRYRILTNSDRGVGQFYFGDDPNRLPVTGIPVNLTLGGVDPITGWAADSDHDDDQNA